MQDINNTHDIVTPLSNEILDLASMLNIPISSTKQTGWIFLYSFEKGHGYVLVTSKAKYIFDTEVSNQVFIEILLDFAAGIPMAEVYLKQGFNLRN